MEQPLSIEYLLIIHANGHGKWFREFQTSSKHQIIYILLWYNYIFLWLKISKISVNQMRNDSKQI